MEKAKLRSVEEASVASMLDAYRNGETNVQSVVRSYLDRIEAYDRKGPALWSTAAVAPPPSEDPGVKQLEANEALMRAAYERAMQQADVDCFIMPCASFPPKLNGDRNTTPTGSRTWIASGLHWPAIVVPMGFTGEDLPSGLQIVGKPWSKPKLIEIAHSYALSTRHRHPPDTVLALN